MATEVCGVKRTREDGAEGREAHWGEMVAQWSQSGLLVRADRV